MRVALVHPFAWPDVRRGGERYLDDLTWYLRGAGHDVDVITGTQSSPGVSVTSHGADRRLRQIRNVRRGSIRLTEPETFGIRALPTLLRRRYDIVHALVPTAALAARSAGHRTVLTMLGHPSAELLAGHPIKERTLRAAIRRASAVTVLSGNVERDVEGLFGRNAVIVPPGVRTDGFAPTQRTAQPSILFASAMRDDKGLGVLLRAFPAVAAAVPAARLVLCGPGDPAWAFAEAGEALVPYRDRVDVIGPGDPADLPARYASAHVTVLPSRNEAFGLVLAESLASGTPVIGCSAGGADDIVNDDVGRIVAHGDVAGLSAALLACLELAADPDATARCVARAAHWDWQSAVGPQHEALYRRVLEQRRV